jgi:hypothetical protein
MLQIQQSKQHLMLASGELRLADDGIAVTFSITQLASHVQLPTDAIKAFLVGKPGVLSAAFEQLNPSSSQEQSSHSLTVTYSPDVTGARRISSILSSLPPPLPSLNPVPYDRDLVVSNEEEQVSPPDFSHFPFGFPFVFIVVTFICSETPLVSAARVLAGLPRYLCSVRITHPSFFFVTHPSFFFVTQFPVTSRPSSLF